MNGKNQSTHVSASSRKAAFENVVSRVSKAIVLILAACCLAACGTDAPPSANRALDVLLIMVDDMNSDLQSFGSPVPVGPNIDRIARRGITYTRAYAQYPQCNQSRTSMLTGLYPEQLDVLTLQDDFRKTTEGVVTLPQHFRLNGWFTARVGKIFHQGVPYGIGEDGLDDALSWDLRINPTGIERSFDESVKTIVPEHAPRPGFGATLSWLGVPGNGDEFVDARVADAAIEILREHKRGPSQPPLFLAVGFYRPHTPFIVPEALLEQCPVDAIELPVVAPDDRDNKPVMGLSDRPYQLEMSPALKKSVIQAYRAAATFADQQIGRVLDELEVQGRLDETIIVFASDHGYQLGSHNLWQKGDLFENSTRTPLIISSTSPDDDGQVHVVPVELLDVYPTILRMAGLEPAGLSSMGRDIAALAENGSDVKNDAYSVVISRAAQTRPELKGRKAIGRSLRTERYRYTEWDKGAEGVELYDYDVDPSERFNRAGDLAYADIETRLREQLHERQRFQTRQVSR